LKAYVAGKGKNGIKDADHTIMTFTGQGNVDAWLQKQIMQQPFGFPFCSNRNQRHHFTTDVSPASPAFERCVCVMSQYFLSSIRASAPRPTYWASCCTSGLLAFSKQAIAVVVDILPLRLSALLSPPPPFGFPSPPTAFSRPQRGCRYTCRADATPHRRWTAFNCVQ